MLLRIIHMNQDMIMVVMMQEFMTRQTGISISQRREPAFHTNSFMNGYYDGFYACSSSSSQILEHDNSESLVILIEFTNRDIYTGANVRIHWVSQYINLLEDSWVRFEFPKGSIGVGESFIVDVTAFNEFDDTKYETFTGYNGPEHQPERVYVDLAYYT